MWKDIKGYEGLYQVSSEGEVKSLDRIVNNRWGVDVHKKERLLKQTINNKGYYKVGLLKNGCFTFHFVHRLVCNAFIENNFNKPCVNHIDSNPSNNNLDNLEWVTYTENQIHSIKLGRRDLINKNSSERFKQFHLNKDNRFTNYAKLY